MRDIGVTCDIARLESATDLRIDAQVKQASIDHAPMFATEEAWVDQVAEATGGDMAQEGGAITDPTLANAGLTELQGQTNGISGEAIQEPTSAAPVSAGDVGNVAGERWDAGASAGAEKGGLDESYEMIPRPSEEVDIPAEPNTISEQPQSTSWADEPQEAGSGVGNQAGEGWDMKAPGEVDNSWGAEPGAVANGWGDSTDATAPADDGFHQVPGRHRGRGGRGRGGDGEFRARGGRRGNFRGGFRGNRGDGEFRGRGRGRGGPRGGAEGGARGS